jgi:hypothetical protein
MAVVLNRRKSSPRSPRPLSDLCARCDNPFLFASPSLTLEAKNFYQLRQCKVTGPSKGFLISVPVFRDSVKFCFNAKYHFAGRSASSISINRGLSRSPSACWIIVCWSWRRNFSAKALKIHTGSGTFHAATQSMRHKSRRTGVTVARLENHNFPLRISSNRMFGRTKSIVVVTGSPVIFFNN